MSERRRAFFFGTVFFGYVLLFRTAPLEEAEAFAELRPVAESAS